MKALITLIGGLLLTCSVYAQPIICSGNPLVGIKGDTYDSVAATGTSLYGSVASSKDGKLFATHNGKVKFIDPATFAVTDSMSMDVNHFTGQSSNDTMFGLRGNGTVCRFNTANKSFIDSLQITGSSPIRLTERPGAKEVWLGGAPVTIVDYTGSLTSSTLSISGSVVSIKFSTDGMKAYANSNLTKRVYIIDAAAKTIVDSIEVPEGPSSIELNSTNSKLFVTIPGKVRVYQTSDKSLIDSVKFSMPVMGLFRHPSRPEMWCVHHFDDSITVFNTDTHNKIDSIAVGSSPFFLAFGKIGTNVKNVASVNSTIKIYPNPATAQVYIEDIKANSTISLYNMNGILLKEMTAIGSTAIISIQDLPPGQYIIRASDTEGNLLGNIINKQ
jgi:YVTN family beta-propeller protein